MGCVSPFNPVEIIFDFIDTYLRARANGNSFGEQIDEDIRGYPQPRKLIPVDPPLDGGYT